VTNADDTSNRTTLTTSYDDGCLTVSGEVHGDNAAALRHALTDPDADGLVTVDMAGVTSLDRAGIRALRAARRTRPFRIVNPSPHVLQVLRGSGTAGMFGIAVAPDPDTHQRFRRRFRTRLPAPSAKAS